MNEKPEWELVDDDARPKQQSGQRDFLFALLGKYPRLKLVGLATAGLIVMTLIALFSVLVMASAAVASGVLLFAAWCKTRFSRSRKQYPAHFFGN